MKNLGAMPLHFNSHPAPGCTPFTPYLWQFFLLSVFWSLLEPEKWLRWQKKGIYQADSHMMAAVFA